MHLSSFSSRIEDVSSHDFMCFEGLRSEVQLLDLIGLRDRLSAHVPPN
jgi:hypothetical protein